MAARFMGKLFTVAVLNTVTTSVAVEVQGVTVTAMKEEQPAILDELVSTFETH
jgi:hypothetical protein